MCARVCPMAFLSLLRPVVASVGMNRSLAAFCKVSRRGYDSLPPGMGSLREKDVSCGFGSAARGGAAGRGPKSGWLTQGAGSHGRPCLPFEGRCQGWEAFRGSAPHGRAHCGCPDPRALHTQLKMGRDPWHGAGVERKGLGWHHAWRQSQEAPGDAAQEATGIPARGSVATRILATQEE